MSETLQEGAIRSAYTTPRQIEYLPIDDTVDYFKEPEHTTREPEAGATVKSDSTTPWFDEEWAKFSTDHPELADMDFDTTPDTPNLYTPIEATNSTPYEPDTRVADFHTAKERARAHLTTELGLDLDHDAMVAKALGETPSAETQSNGAEVSDETIKSAAVDLGSTALGNILGQQAERVGRRARRRQQREEAAEAAAAAGSISIRSRIAGRLRSITSDFPEEKEKRERKPGRGRAIFALGVAATLATVVAVTSTSAIQKMNDPSFHEGQRVVQPAEFSKISESGSATEAHPTPQPTVESVKPKRAMKDTKDQIIYTEIDEDGEGVWDAVEEALPKRMRTDDNINDIKNGVLRVRGLSEQDASQLHKGWGFSFKIERSR